MTAGQGEIAPYTLPRYTRQWVYTFLTLAIAFTGYFKIQHPLVLKSPARPVTALDAQESYWFFVLELPSPNPHSSQGELYAKSSDWLNSLRVAGYHPMLFSDVRARMAKGMLLPEKTIILSIDEALLTTYNVYQPLLKDFKFPAVLVAALDPLRQGDHGYLSYNAVQKLPNSGLWDVVLLDDNGHSQLLAPQDVPVTLPMPPGKKLWSSRTDRSLANTLPDLRKPRSLSIDWKWSGQDVVNRLQAETPVHPHGSRLGARQVMGRLFGIVIPEGAASENRFSLAASSDQRSGDIGWLGTRGLENFQLNFSLEDATGQVWWLLRSTGDGKDNIRVGFDGGRVLVKEQRAGQERLLAMTEWPRVFPWKGTIELRGSDLQVQHNGKTIVATHVTVRSGHHTPSMLQMMVYDQIYGAGQVRDVTLDIKPLLSLDSLFNEGSL